MSTFRKILAGVYGVHLFLIMPWFLGAIYRQEQSLWAWQEYTVQAARHGDGNALFGLYLYVFFYSAFFVLPYVLLGIRYPAVHPAHSPLRAGRAILSCWCLFSAVLFLQPLYAFVREATSALWREHLSILWLVATVVVIIVVRNMETLRRKKNEPANYNIDHKL